ncbi:hypothetical protein H8E88_00870 [candidate division KSB1 bacterium]|nr:hypothetical protein [candidate division KSB1 bacterium]
MKKLSFNLALIMLSILLVVVGCESLKDKGITSVDESISDAFITSENNSILNSEFAIMNAAGLVIEDADAVFSIGWKPFFNPVDSQLDYHSHVFAVAPNTDTTMNPHFRSGKDMGLVYLQYDGNNQELDKIERLRGGIFYSLGKDRPGKKGGPRHYAPEGEIVEIPFIPGAAYSFEATGTDDFSPLTVEVVAPDNLIQITSPARGDSMNPENDLIVSWSGGVEGQNLVITLKPEFKHEGFRGPQEDRGSHRGGRQGGSGRGGHGGPPESSGQGSHGMGTPREGNHGNNPRPEESFGGPGLEHHLFEEYALRYLVEDNTGEFTVPAADIQDVLAKVEAGGFRLEVMQMITTETEVEDSKYIAQLRTSDMMFFKIEE